MHRGVSALLVLLGSIAIAAQDKPSFTLEDGTPIRLRLGRTVSSEDSHVGDTVDFEVLEEVRVNDVLVIRKGALALGTVTAVQPKKRMARGGKLDINIDDVKLVTGDKAALRAIKDVKGGGHTGAMVGGMVATSIVFFPAAPFFLFMHGHEISIPKGTETTAYINGTAHLDAHKFLVAERQAETASQSALTAQRGAVTPSTPPKQEAQQAPATGECIQTSTGACKK
jgi:hypothetical protein